MSLYGSFYNQEMATHCTTEDVNSLYRKALKDQDEPMAILSMAELIKRGNTDLVAQAITDATEAGCFTAGHFSAVFANALANLGSRDPLLRRLAQTIRENGSRQETSESLRLLDKRIAVFLASFFAKKGRGLVCIGCFASVDEWHPHPLGYLIIEDGRILNAEEIPDILSILDSKGITNPLPAFDGNEFDLYTIIDGKWVKFEGSGGKQTFLCASYRPSSKNHS